MLTTPPSQPGHAIREALTPMLRKAFRSVGLVTSDERAFSDQITALCERIERVGEGRRDPPFCDGAISGNR